MLKANPPANEHHFRIHQAQLKDLKGQILVWFDETGVEIERAVMGLKDDASDYDGSHIYLQTFFKRFDVNLGVSISKERLKGKDVARIKVSFSYSSVLLK